MTTALPVVAPTQAFLSAVELRFQARLALADHGLRFLGPTLRGAFGYALKQLVCQVEHRCCARCLLRCACAYPAIFEGLPPSGATLMPKSSTVPQPFVLVLVGPGEWDGGPQELRWGIRLFGQAARWAPYLIETFIRIGERGVGPRRVPFSLEQVVDASSGRRVWSSGEEVVDLPVCTAVTSETAPRSGPVRWTFHTPLHLREEGTQAARIDGLGLVLAGRRRLRMLQAFFGPEAYSTPATPVRLDASMFRTLDQQLRPWSIRRFSGRQQRRIALSGILGSMIIEGPWDQAGPWMPIVDMLHLGKYATFGFGRATWEQLV